jgi:hypothetical protein
MTASGRTLRGRSLRAAPPPRRCCGTTEGGPHLGWCLEPHGALVVRFDHSRAEDALEAATVRACAAWLEAKGLL